MQYNLGKLALMLLMPFHVAATEPQQDPTSANSDKPLLRKTVDISKKTIKNVTDGASSAADTVLIKPATKVADKTKQVIKNAGESGKKIGKEVKQAVSRNDEQPEPQLLVEVSGVEGALLDNINAYLADLPTTKSARSSYLFTFEEKVREASQALGYYHASIKPELDRSQEPWQLKLQVDAGHPVTYRTVKVELQGEATQDLAFKARIERIAIKPNDVINHQKYDTLKNELIALGLLRGYFDGNMVTNKLDIDRVNNVADLTLIYDSKKRYRFGKVTFSGTDLDPELLESMVPFGNNQPYHNDAVSNFTSTLLSVGYFKDVKVLPQPERNSTGLVPIKVELSPAPRYLWELGAGYATDTEARVSITLRTPKLNSKGHSLETRLEISKVNPELSFEYRIPLGHPRNDILQLGGSFGKEEFGDLESTMTQGSVSRTTVISNSWTRRYYLRYLNESWDQLDSSFTADYLLPGISFSKTKREGPPLDPTRGFRQLYTLEYGTPIDSDAEKTARFHARLRWVETPIFRHRLTSRLDLGFNSVTDEKAQQLAPSLRFFAGGDQTIRGFSYQSVAPSVTNSNGTRDTVGGRYLAAASVEYQYYLYDKWRIATFIDGGSAFDDRELKSVDWKGSTGLGLHWISPIGPIKAELGYGFSEDDPPFRLHITIGAEL